MIRSLSALTSGLWLMLIVASTAQAAPQTFNTALPVAQGEFVFRQQFFHLTAGDGELNPADRDVDVRGGVSVLGYGVNGNFVLFGVVPYLNKRLEITTPGGDRITRRTNGIGDARLFGRYTVYRDDARGRTFRIAPFGGVETPTGDNEDRDSLGVLPPTLQRGSGSWDLFGGVVVTYQKLAYQLDVATSYKINTEANDFEFGDEARLDASLQYRLWPRKLESGVPGFLYAVIESNLIHRGSNAIGGLADTNSGGTTLFLAPGLQYVTKRWVIEGIVQLPAVQSLNGMALEDHFTVRAGFRFNF